MYNQPEKLYIKEIEKGTVKKPKTVKLFLKLILMYDNITKINTCATYYDKECKLLHCQRNKLRSFDDILTMVKTYYPSYDERKLMLVLLHAKYRHNRSDNYFIFYFYCCSTMERIRVTVQLSRFGNPIQTYFIMSNVSKYKSKYSWKELLNMCDINNEDDFKAFYKINNKPKIKNAEPV